MRIAWKKTDDHWLAHIGPCWISLRPMDWYHPQARDHREAINRTWIYTIQHFSPELTASGLTEGIFEVDRAPFDGGVRKAKEHVVAIARAFEVCKRPRHAREAIEPASVAWLEQRLLSTLRESYAYWREKVSSYGRGNYPEPRWSTAQLAGDAAQYTRPDDLDVTDKRFYLFVRAALDRLKRRKLVTTSHGLDDRGRATTLWTPV